MNKHFKIHKSILSSLFGVCFFPLCWHTHTLQQWDQRWRQCWLQWPEAAQLALQIAMTPLSRSDPGERGVSCWRWLWCFYGRKEKWWSDRQESDLRSNERERGREREREAHVAALSSGENVFYMNCKSYWVSGKKSERVPLKIQNTYLYASPQWWSKTFTYGLLLDNGW